MFLLVPAYPGCPGQTAVRWLLLLLTPMMSMCVCVLADLWFRWIDAYDERVCMCASEDKTGGGGGGGHPEQPNDPNKPPINNDHRPPRPTSDAGNDPNVNVNPNPTYQTPVGCSLTHS